MKDILVAVIIALFDITYSDPVNLLATAFLNDLLGVNSRTFFVVGISQTTGVDTTMFIANDKNLIVALETCLFALNSTSKNTNKSIMRS